ncbi:hypothetical protein GCM10023335_19430 [Streptomyces siamensis]|uniref:Uncharacterized protein n=1 Tax=Streptomyces siamensis TaxID=1274986 RepID=A0ABP9IN11_9ACTN
MEASSFPEAPPKDTRTLAPDFFSAEIRDATAESPRAYVPFHFGVQALPSEITKARLYVDGDPLESVAEAVVALTYGAYEVADDGLSLRLGAGAVCVPPDRGEAASDAPPPPEEHPAQASATRETSPAAGFRKLLIA